MSTRKLLCAAALAVAAAGPALADETANKADSCVKDTIDAQID